MNIVPAHEVVIMRFAELAQEEIARMACLARLATDRDFTRLRRSKGARQGWVTRTNNTRGKS